MKIVKMDRRFEMTQYGFTHQLRSMGIKEKHEVCKFFQDKYGPSRDHVLVGDKYVEQRNGNWREVRAKRRFTGGTKIYVKHEHDLTLLGLKFSEYIIK